MNETESVESKKLLRVGIYERLSDEDKDKTNKEDDSESIKNQRHLLMTEIEKRPNFVLVDEYCDEDYLVQELIDLNLKDLLEIVKMAK